MIGKVKYKGDNGKDLDFDILNDHEYDVLAIQGGMLRIICEDDYDYLFSALNPKNLFNPELKGHWEIVEDPEGKLKKLIDFLKETEKKKNHSKKNNNDFDER